MIISLNWLKKFTDINMPIDELTTLIGARLVEIEEVVDLGAKYKDVVIAKVITSEMIEGSDHLNLVQLDDGGKTVDVERGENGYIQVVCGAPNMRSGLTVSWLPPGSTVPETFGSDGPFVLGARKLRGVMSNGMIASAKELDLFDDHSGILELDDGFTPGSSFAEVYELNDYLLDIENKSLTHRPDTFGIIGFAREIAAIQGEAFQTPEWLRTDEPVKVAVSNDITLPVVTIDDSELSRRYQAVVLTGADGSAPSPLHMQSYLARVGVRPINAVVDVTNYLMMLTGQPLHAFDYDKVLSVSGGRADIHVRAGREGEELTLLDGRTIKLTSEDIVIAAGETPVALAGAMGGSNTEIDKDTKNIILESATFNLYNLRATQMRHGIFSEAITRFTKGQPPELTAPVLREAVRMLQEYAGANVITDIVEAYPGRAEPVVISLSSDTVNGILGSKFTIADIVETLRNVEFETEIQDGKIIQVQSPYWRGDIHIPEDLIEEIGRLKGFDMIEPSLPVRDFTAMRPGKFDLLRAQVRSVLARAGANEVLTYSFVHGDILTRAGQRLEDSYRITNSISPNLQYYRQTLTPNLLGLVHPNIKQGQTNFALYEINKAHPKPHGLTDEGVPKETNMLALVIASQRSSEGAPYYRARKMLEYLGESLGLDLVYAPIDTDPDYPVTAPFEYRRSALVTDRKTDTFLGIVGEYKKTVSHGFKLPEYIAGFEISTSALAQATQKLPSSYTPLSRYPGTERDICFKVSIDINYQQIINPVEEVLKDTALETRISLVDIYQLENASTKNITIRLSLTSHGKTLTGEEVSHVIDKVTGSVATQTNAVVV